MKKNYSLRRRLITRIFIPILVGMALTFLMASYWAWHESEEVYDAQLVHFGKVLLQLTQHEIRKNNAFDLGLENTNLRHKYERNIGFRIWVDNKLITQSPNTLIFETFEAPPHFSDHQFGKHKWRFFVFLDAENKIKIEVSERYDIRYELIEQLMLALSLPNIIFIPLIFLIVWIVTKKSLEPIVKISADVDSRNSDDLSPIAKRSIAEEIAPLVYAIDRLFDRIGESFRREREFTDHAAHELSTPLAAMKTQTQVLLKRYTTIPEAKDELKNLLCSIDRASHMVSQLLSLARLQKENFPMRKSNLSECLYDSIDDIKLMAQQKHIEIVTHINDDIFINAHDLSISILLKNLLDNAVKYTPPNGQIFISLSADGLLEVADTGEGLADSDKNRAFERFARFDKSGQTGSGLGLAIAKWIASAHDVEIELKDNTPQGLKVKIHWKILF